MGTRFINVKTIFLIEIKRVWPILWEEPMRKIVVDFTIRDAHVLR